MIVHFDRDITVDQLRAALAALEVDLLPGEGGEYRARRRYPSAPTATRRRLWSLTTKTCA